VTALTDPNEQVDDWRVMNEERFATKIPTTIVAESLRTNGKIRNLSSGGLFVGAASVPEQGDTVLLQFDAPNGESVKARGLVWWTTINQEVQGRRITGFGVRLLWASGTYQRLLEQLVR
jgi:Tfp pilus assembly protein PilZ